MLMPGATLGGANGTLGDIDATRGGTVSPGFQHAGSLTAGQVSLGTQADFDASASAPLVATHAKLAGTLSTSDPKLVNLPPDKAVTIVLTSGGTSGQFSGGNRPLFGQIPFGAIYDGTHVTIVRLTGPHLEQLVEGAYIDLLHRVIDTSALQSVSQQLNVDFQQFVRNILSSSEYHTQVVQGMFETLFNRAADPSGLSTWVAFLAQGNSSLQLEAILMSSTEYLNDHGGTNAGFVAAVFLDGLGRGVDAAGNQTWGQALANGQSRAAVAANILMSAEGNQDIVDRVFTQYLQAPPSADELKQEMQTLQGSEETVLDVFNGVTVSRTFSSPGAPEDVIVDALNSPDYLNRTASG
jgi:hypothetical protein